MKPRRQPSRDELIVIAAVAWWISDPADIGYGYPPSEYSHYAIEFADKYKLGAPLLGLVGEINSGIFGPMRDLNKDVEVAWRIDFGLIQYGCGAPDGEMIHRKKFPLV